MRWILASASPRRKELLEKLGVEFEVCPAQGEEKITEKQPSELVMELAGQKAEEVAGRTGGDVLVLGADTIVVFQGKALGKPADEQDACRMLEMLSGNVHEVYTGVALINQKTGEKKRFFEKTEVFMSPMEKKEILDYIASGEPMDKAGAYGIQGIGAKFIHRINGDYYNVVGLPISRIYREAGDVF